MTLPAIAADPVWWLGALHLGPLNLLLAWIEARFIAKRVRLKQLRPLLVTLLAANLAAAWTAQGLLHLDGAPLHAALHHTPWTWLRAVLVLVVPLICGVMLGVEALLLLPFVRPSRLHSRAKRRTWWRAFLHANILTGVPLLLLYGLASAHSLLWQTTPVRASKAEFARTGRFTIFLSHHGGRVTALDLPSLATRDLAMLDPSLVDPVFRFATDAAPGTTLDLADATPNSVLRTPVHVFLPGDEVPACSTARTATGCSIHTYLEHPTGEGPRFAGATATAGSDGSAWHGFTVNGGRLALATPLLALAPREAFVLPDNRVLMLAGDRLLMLDSAGRRTTELARARQVLPVGRR
jgi:hypothetical protein